jgi:hypothetical protein
MMTHGLRSLALLGLAAFAGCAGAPDVAASSGPSGADVVQAATGPATVTTDAASYTFATPITVTFAGLDGDPGDWVAIAPQGSPLTTTTRWSFTGGGASGTKQFEGPATGGSYVARAFDASSNLLGESDPFTTADPSDTHAAVAATQTAYTMADPITITWSGLPGNAQDWIAIAPQGFPVNDQAEWQFTGGGASGSATFTGGFQLTNFPPGNYVARAYLNGTFTLAAESSVFTIGVATGPSVTTDRTAYTTLQPIEVRWAGLPGNAKDWVAVAPAGSDPSNAPQWTYVNGAVNGSVKFNTAALGPGTYVARAFVDDSYTVIAESPSFTVTTDAQAAVTTDAATYAVEQTITISWTGLPGNTKDWVGYAPAGSPDTTVTRWLYTNSTAGSGSLALEGALAPGTYVARSFVNDSYTKAAESAPFVIQ